MVKLYGCCPKYVKVFKHKIPGVRQVLKVKGGTQIIDGFWKVLRSQIKHVRRAPGNAAMTRKVRSAQWAYWKMCKDLWLETGKMCKDLHSK